DLHPGSSERLLVLQDRRVDLGYEPGSGDLMDGFLGDRVTINGHACPSLDVESRVCRFRILNASNARTYRLAVRDGDGKPLPMILIGTDGGLLSAPRSCRQLFIASAERVDLLLDLRDRPLHEQLTLETLAFDPMHMNMPPKSEGNAPGPESYPSPQAASAGTEADVHRRPMQHDTAVEHSLHHAGSLSFAHGEARTLATLHVI